MAKHSFRFCSALTLFQRVAPPLDVWKSPCMKAVNLLDVLNKARFKPFDLCLDNGRMLRVKHPDRVLLNEPKTTAVIADGEHLHIVDLDHVSSLTLVAK
jgi:hypothetical protein